MIIGGLLSRELGGRQNTQLFAALASALMPAVLGAGHILEPTTLDIMFWSALALVVVRVGRTGDCRYWLLGGFVLGAGLANKHIIGFCAGYRRSYAIKPMRIGESCRLTFPVMPLPP